MWQSAQPVHTLGRGEDTTEPPVSANGSSARPRQVACLAPSPLGARRFSKLASAADVEVCLFQSYPAMLTAIETLPPALLVLTFGALPGDPDLSLLRSHAVPVLALVHDSRSTKEALRSGAHVTLQEPVDDEVFALTVRSLAGLPTGQPFAIARQGHRLGDLTISVINHTVEREGVRHLLTPTEWQLLAFLLAYPNRVHTRRALAVGAWGPGYADREEQAELFVSRLRRKVEKEPSRPQLIVTVPGAGYRLVCATSLSPTDLCSQPEPVALRNPQVRARWEQLYEDLLGRTETTVAALREIAGSRREFGLQVDTDLLEAQSQHLRRRLSQWSLAAQQDC